jgi:hypothetical protein
MQRSLGKHEAKRALSVLFSAQFRNGFAISMNDKAFRKIDTAQFGPRFICCDESTTFKTTFTDERHVGRNAER